MTNPTKETLNNEDLLDLSNRTAISSLLGIKIKKLRKEKGLTLEQLADKIGSGKSYIWEIENKIVKNPSAEKLAAIAKELDVTIDYLIDDTKKEVDEDLENEVLLNKLMLLCKADKKRIIDIVNAWSK